MGRIFWLKAVVVVSFVIALVMSANLWLASRTYPLVPVISGLPAITHPFDWILFAALLLLLGATLIASKPRLYIWVFLGIIAVLCVYDQTRWQPYIYMYGFLLAAPTLFSWKREEVQ